MSLIDELVGCKECGNQWFEENQLSNLNCCNNKICKNCENTHICTENIDSGGVVGDGDGNKSGRSSVSTSSSSIENTTTVDKSVENIYSSFLSVNSSYSIGLGTSIDRSSNNNEVDMYNNDNDEDEDDDDSFEQDQVFEHIVFPTDTLQGISIKYGCSVDELKSINKLRSINSSSLISKTILLIPKKSNQIRQQPQDIFNNKDVLEFMKKNLIAKFIKKSKCTNQSMVENYLEKHGYDFFKALIDFNNNKLENEINKSSSSTPQSISSSLSSTPQSISSTPPKQQQIFSYQEFNFGSSPSSTPNKFNDNNDNVDNNIYNINNSNNSISTITSGFDTTTQESNSNNLLNNSDFLIKSYREKYSDIPTQTSVKNINKTSIKKVHRTCCSWF